MYAALFSPAPSLRAAPVVPSDTGDHLLLLKRPSSRPPSIPLPSYPNLSARPFLHSSSSSPPRPRPPSTAAAFCRTHRRAAAGYAAALADVARCDGALDAAERDAGRLVRAVRAAMAADPAAVEEEVVRRVLAECGGGFYKRLATLVGMLVGKGKAGVVGEVMAEFITICDELRGAARVVVMPAPLARRKTVEEGEPVSGAAKVKVRHLFAV